MNPTPEQGIQPAAATAPVPRVPSQTEPVYPAAQLVDHHQVFGTSRAIVATAFRLAHKDKASIPEATALIQAFQRR